MNSTGHVTFRAPALLLRSEAAPAVARSLRSLRGVSAVTLDLRSGAISVRYDPKATSAAAVRTRAHAPARSRSETADALAAAASWVPTLSSAVRLALATVA